MILNELARLKDIAGQVCSTTYASLNPFHENS